MKICRAAEVHSDPILKLKMAFFSLQARCSQPMHANTKRVNRNSAISDACSGPAMATGGRARPRKAKGLRFGGPQTHGKMSLAGTDSGQSVRARAPNLRLKVLRGYGQAGVVCAAASP